MSYSDLQIQETAELDASNQDDEAHGTEEPRMRAWRRPRATLNGIVRFLPQCPAIQDLGVAFDANVSVLAPRRPFKMRGAPNRILQVLHVGLSPIGDPFTVAALLSNVLISVEDLDSRWAPLETEEYYHVVEPESTWSRARIYRTRWERVQELVPMFSSVRVQEQKWNDRLVDEA
ncbi:hypothetical protein C8Q79DRAFT_540767 [Trametes meyenii]|nr:hypothetical protein C8Q79DRAFT_540767 [Trametes meyenii]